jgi:phage minor structural protein
LFDSNTIAVYTFDGTTSGQYAPSSTLITGAIDIGDAVAPIDVSMDATTPDGTSVIVNRYQISSDGLTWGSWYQMVSQNTIKGQTDHFIRFEITFTTSGDQTPTLNSITLYKKGNIGYIDPKKKPQKPSLFLAKPNGEIIAKLSTAYDVSRKVKLGDINELTFSLPYEIEVKGEIIRNKHVDKTKDRYLVKHVLGQEVEWYQISKIEDSMDTGDSKSVTAMLLPYELRDKTLRKYTADTKNCSEVLRDVLVGPDTTNPLTLWKIGYVDGSFDVMYRSFDVSSKTTLDFIMEVAETFGAIIVWHTDTRTVDFRRPELIGTNRGLKFSYGKYVKTLNKESITDEMTTRLKVFGKDDLSIQRVNPTGANYIESFAYFLYPFQQDAQGNVTKKSDYMSDALCKAIIAYDSKVDEVKGSFKTLVDQKATAVDAKATLELEMADLENQMALIQDRIDIQHSLTTDKEFVITSQVNKYTGSNTTYPFKMSGGFGGRTFAIMVKAVNASGITITYSGVSQQIQSNVWKLITKKSVLASQTVNDSIAVSGTTSTDIHLLVVEISSFEFKGVIYEGIKLTSNGAANSVVTSTEVAVDWGTINIGYKLYIKKNAGDEWLFDATQFVGNVTSTSSITDAQTGDITEWTATLDASLASGEYAYGYAFVGNNDNIIIDTYSIDHKQMQIDLKTSDIASYDNQIAGYDYQIYLIHDQLSLDKFFTTQALRDERNQFIIEKEWSDSNYIDDQTLYDAAVKKFEQLRSPQTVINIDIVNFLEIIEAQRDWDKLILGDTVTIKYEKIGVDVEAKIIGIDYDYENAEIKLTIANVKDIETDEEKLIKMLYKSISTSATVDSKKFDWDGASRDVSEVQQIIENQWDAAKRSIVAGVNESVTVDARGLTIKDPNDSNTFLRAMHGVLAITNDGGNSFKHAITSTGIVAERLYGQIIVGQTLTLGDQDGILKIVGNKATISDRNGTEVLKLGLYDTSTGDKFGLALLHPTHRVIMDRDDGFKVEKKNGDGSYTNVAWLDANGKLNLNDIIATGSIEATTIKAGVKLTVGNINVGNLITYINDGLQAFNNWIKDGMIEVGSISADKIKTDQLIVGTNIAMGPNATISWGKISNIPSDLATTSDINWNNISTTITPTTIWTGTLGANAVVANNISANAVTSDKIAANSITADKINANAITADKLDANAITSKTITGCTISGGTINVTTNVSIGNQLILDANNYGAGVEWKAGGVTRAEIYIDPGGHGMFISNGMGGGIYAGSQRIDQPIIAVFG